MNMSILSRVIDERFLSHRLRSTSAAEIIGGVVAIALFAYRYYQDGPWSWDLFAVAATIVAVRLAAMGWYELAH